MLARFTKEKRMLMRTIAASAVGAALMLGCTPTPPATAVVMKDKLYVVTPDAMTVKVGILSGQFTEMKVTERIEGDSGKVYTPARLTGKLVLKNVSSDQTLRLLGGKVSYIDMQGKPIKLEDNRTEPTLKVSNSYGSQERLDPGQDSTQSMEAEFPAEALANKRLKEIRIDLSYIPSAFREETLKFGVAITPQP
jgi:hypothetical protein